MEKITHPGQAGTVESNDVIITVAPGEPGSGTCIELTSPVIKQYGEQIKAVIQDALQSEGVTDVIVNANDKGALDCTIRARLKTAIARARAGL